MTPARVPIGPLPPAYFARTAVELARDMIGATLLVDGVGGEIVEAEAYDRDDPASHSFSGQTRRNASMFGPVGRAYVYRSYGIHWCLNIVCARPGEGGSAVLIRALKPTDGLDEMRLRRPGSTDRDLCRGPGRLCQALGINGGFDGRPLDAAPFALSPPSPPPVVAEGPRIGLTKGVETPWRFGCAGSPFLSRRFARLEPAEIVRP